MKTIVRKLLMIKTIKLRLRNLDNLHYGNIDVQFFNRNSYDYRKTIIMRQ